MKNSFFIRFSCIACTLLFIGCNLLSSNDGRVQVYSDKDVYEVGDTVTVNVINNRSTSIFRYRACDFERKHETYTIETKKNETWVDFLPPPKGCHPVNPWIEIPRGQVHTLKSVFSEPGEYRHRFGLYSSTSTDNLLSATERISNTYVIIENQSAP